MDTGVYGVEGIETGAVDHVGQAQKRKLNIIVLEKTRTCMRSLCTSRIHQDRSCCLVFSIMIGIRSCFGLSLQLTCQKKLLNFFPLNWSTLWHKNEPEFIVRRWFSAQKVRCHPYKDQILNNDQNFGRLEFGHHPKQILYAEIQFSCLSIKNISWVLL